MGAGERLLRECVSTERWDIEQVEKGKTRCTAGRGCEQRGGQGCCKWRDASAPTKDGKRRSGVGKSSVRSHYTGGRFSLPAMMRCFYLPMSSNLKHQEVSVFKEESAKAPGAQAQCHQSMSQHTIFLLDPL